MGLIPALLDRCELLINILSTFLLLLHTQIINYLSSAAAAGTLSSADFGLQRQLVIISSAALVALLVATGLAVYKPRGLTPYGRWRKQRESRQALQP